MARTKTLNSNGKKISKKNGPRYPTQVIDIGFNFAGYPIFSATAAALLRKMHTQKVRPPQPDHISGMAPYSRIPFAETSFIIGHWFLETALNETAMFFVRRAYQQTKQFASETEAVKQIDDFFSLSVSSPVKKVEAYDKICGTQIAGKADLMEKIWTICAIRDLLYHHEANRYRGGKAPACVAKLFGYISDTPDQRSWIKAGWSPVLGSKSAFDFVVQTVIDFTDTMSAELGHKHRFQTVDHLAKKPGIVSLCAEPGLVPPKETIKSIQEKYTDPKTKAKVIAFDGTRRGTYYLFSKNKKYYVVHVTNRGRERTVPAWEILKIKNADRIGWIPIPWKGMDSELKRSVRERVSDIEIYRSA